jgi:hypothetical protein
MIRPARTPCAVPNVAPLLPLLSLYGSIKSIPILRTPFCQAQMAGFARRAYISIENRNPYHLHASHMSFTPSAMMLKLTVFVPLNRPLP